MNIASINAILQNREVPFMDRVITNLTELAKAVTSIRGIGMEISSTTGVFDLLHAGHVRYLQATRGFAGASGISIVEVDTDELVRARKQDNDNRPIVPLEERLEMIASLRCSGLFYVLDVGEDPIEFIKVIKPDVFVVSKTSHDSDEEYLKLVRPHCGRVEVLEPQAKIFTTERIRRLSMLGVVDQLKKVRDLADQLIETANGGGK